MNEGRSNISLKTIAGVILVLLGYYLLLMLPGINRVLTSAIAILLFPIIVIGGYIMLKFGVSLAKKDVLMGGVMLVGLLYLTYSLLYFLDVAFSLPRGNPWNIERTWDITLRSFAHDESLFNFIYLFFMFIAGRQLYHVGISTFENKENLADLSLIIALVYVAVMVIYLVVRVWNYARSGEYIPHEITDPGILFIIIYIYALYYILQRALS